MNPTQQSPCLSNRRVFLRAAGVSLALPLLESLGKRVFAEDSPVGALPGKVPGAERPMRMVCIGNLLGFYPPAFFPKNTGSGFDLPVDLESLQPHQKDITIFSGLDHGVKGGHFAMSSFLSGVRTADAKGMPEGNITVDQRAAETIGGATRFSSLALGSESGIHGGCLMSWTRSGTRVPPISTPRELFRKLFVSEGAFGLNGGYHAFSHHGQRPEAIEALIKMERYQIEQFARFLARLNSIEDGARTLLDHAMVLFGSGMGNANSHTNSNLPLVLAGGGFKHGEHKAYPEKGLGRQPLCNLFVSMLQRFGVDVAKFGTSSSTLTGLV